MLKFEEAKKYWKKFFTDEMEKDISAIWRLKFDFHFNRLKSQGYDNLQENPIFYEACELADKDLYEIYESKAYARAYMIKLNLATQDKFFRDFFEISLEYLMDCNTIKEIIDLITGEDQLILKTYMYNNNIIDLEGDLTKGE